MTEKEKQDRQADIFAAALLMPEDEFRAMWDAKAQDVFMLGGHFGVPVAVVELRARILGLMEWKK